MNIVTARAVHSFAALMATGKKAAIPPDSTIGPLNDETLGSRASTEAFTTGFVY
jgi:hypothetical protein